jgi:predicted RNase H-like HicB family nuclease
MNADGGTEEERSTKIHERTRRWHRLQSVKQTDKDTETRGRGVAGTRRRAAWEITRWGQKIDQVLSFAIGVTNMTELTLTAVYEEAEEGGFIGYVAELPGANTQGETLEEARENLSEAIQLILEANREEFERKFTTSAKVTRERLVLRAA